MTSAMDYSLLIGVPVIISVALQILKLWQVSAIRLILLSPNLYSKFLIRAEADLD